MGVGAEMRKKTELVTKKTKPGVRNGDASKAKMASGLVNRGVEVLKSVLEEVRLPN